MKNYLEKSTSLHVPLIKGLLKFWPITCPAKEVIFIQEIEEVLDLMNTINNGPGANHQAEAGSRISDFLPQLLRRLLSTSQGMHYQAAERALLLLNSETIQKLVKANMAQAYPIVVHGLL